ncbi:MAG: PHP domain-containing protein, partial [Sphingobacteriales bacterium]
SYTELQVTTNFSFLRGGSHPEELVEMAAAYGYKKIAVTDHNTLAGIVRAHVAAKKAGITLIPGCRLDLLDGPSLLAYPKTQAGYSTLSGLLTLGNRRAEKGDCHLYRADVFEHSKDMIFVALAPNTLTTDFALAPEFEAHLRTYKSHLGSQLYLSMTRRYQGDDHKLLFRLATLARDLNIELVATNDVHYHMAERRELQDILTCVREKCTIQTAGLRLHSNAERHLKSIEEMKRLFRLYPEAIENAQKIADACNFSLDMLKYVYPEELTTNGRTPQEELEFLTWQGATEKFGEQIPDKLNDQIIEELAFMKKKELASYFLTVHDFVHFARTRDILCQGRGSAANSVVCYCLGITSVDPTKFKLLFARFMSDARDEPPDIDVDFEHERREEVIQYIYEKYGRDRAAIVATVTQQRHKGAIRDVGKAMGLSVDTLNRLSTSSWHYSGEWLEDDWLAAQGMNPHDPHSRGWALR